nr:immunoglobulin heavy chain junction region [Macaca mulatta]MOV45026.1 immunoglobulin heavy chain junction region [Macaca mulatta]
CARDEGATYYYINSLDVW